MGLSGGYLNALSIALAALVLDVGCGAPANLPSTSDASSNRPEADDVPETMPADGASPSVGELPSPRLFQVIDPVEERTAVGFVCPIGLCSWFGSPIALGERGGALNHGGSLVPPMPPRAGSQAAWQVRLSPGTGGLDLGLDIHGPAFPSLPYPDLSAYAGVAFWARSDLPDMEITVAIEDDKVLATGYVDALDSGRPWFTRRVQIGSTWRRHVLLFDDFRQQLADGSQSSERLHTTAIWSLHLLNGLNGKPVDYQFDDVALICRGQCPKPAFEVPFEVEAAGDEEAGWVSGEGTEPARGCAEIASLSAVPPAAWFAGPEERILLRVRVKGSPATAVPLWKWIVERVPTGEELQLESLDDETSVVTLPAVNPGEYRIRAHTHHPTTQVCGAELTLRL